MKILFPDRIVNRHVGGNTTYAVALRDGLISRGHAVGTIPSAGHPIPTMLMETGYGMTSQSGVVLHYSADTGPLLPVRTPSVLTVHGVASRWIDVARTPRQEWVWRQRVGRAIKSTGALITVSESAADDISEIFGVERSEITVIHHGIDHERFASRQSLSDEVSCKLNGRPFALYLGNVEPRKNLVELVRAFERPQLKQAGVQLVIAGRPAWNFTEAMREISDSSITTYLGFVSDSDRIALMQSAELFVFPSLYEGFGFPVLEAMAAGTPVVASRRGSLAEVAGPSWNLAQLDADSIANEVSNALEAANWRRNVIAEGQAWARQFTWEASLQAHLSTYRKVVQ